MTQVLDFSIQNAAIMSPIKPFTFFTFVFWVDLNVLCSSVQPPGSNSPEVPAHKASEPPASSVAEEKVVERCVSRSTFSCMLFSVNPVRWRCWCLILSSGFWCLRLLLSLRLPLPLHVKGRETRRQKIPSVCRSAPRQWVCISRFSTFLRGYSDISSVELSVAWKGIFPPVEEWGRSGDLCESLHW